MFPLPILPSFHPDLALADLYHHRAYLADLQAQTAGDPETAAAFHRQAENLRTHADAIYLRLDQRLACPPPSDPHTRRRIPHTIYP